MQGELKYLYYTVEDFIRDEFFQQWMFRPQLRTNAFWKEWIPDHPQKEDEVRQAADFLEMFSFKTHYPTTEKVEISLAQITKKRRLLLFKSKTLSNTNIKLH